MRSRVQVSLPLQNLRKPLAAGKWFFFYYSPSYTRCGRLAIRHSPSCKIPAPNNLHRFHHKAPLHEAILRCAESVQTGVMSDCTGKKGRKKKGGRVYGGARQEREECKRWREEGPAEKGAKAVFPKFHLPTKRKPPATQVAGGHS